MPDIDSPFQFLLLVGIFVFWSLAYVLIIWKGFRDRTCGIPFAALCANLMWEFIYLFVFPHGWLRDLGTAIWLALDLVILYLFLRYTKNGLWASNRFKAIVLSFSLLLAFLLQVGFSLDFDDAAGIYTGFGINLMMSLLFVRMVLTQSTTGQSVLIGYAKMLGTFCASLVYYRLNPDDFLLNVLYVSILLLDLIYIYLLSKRSHTT
ncbi:transmembrane-type terpene cyclase [Paenibacillus koleovorans]|uniref:transmembrane-type terpene cyclase n=1 Tax=Paenibacillus koleovorans TaxID=121608 RepID=UPI000FD8F40E|nr:hypothetical protein [Paenibacillus koleovorans]